jgi:hypothetical protein
MDLDAMIADITAEKTKLEKLTKKITNNKSSPSKKSQKNHILEVQSPSPPSHAPAEQPQEPGSDTSSIETKLQLNPNDFQNFFRLVNGRDAHNGAPLPQYFSENKS